jgi:hypothetical protein
MGGCLPARMQSLRAESTGSYGRSHGRMRAADAIRGIGDHVSVSLAVLP